MDPPDFINTTKPKWLQGLLKRKWLYLVIVTVAIALISDWHFKKQLYRNKEKPTFEQLEAQIHCRDSIFSMAWRGIWAKLPPNIQSELGQLTPSPPARQIRLTACSLLSGHGEKAFPLVVAKLKDPDPQMKQTALNSLFFLKIADDTTWDSISAIIMDHGNTQSLRRQAFLVLVALHRNEPQFSEFLDELAVSETALIDSISRISFYSPLSSISFGPVSPESKIIAFLSHQLTDSFFDLLFEKDAPAYSEMAIRLLRNSWGDIKRFRLKITKYLENKDDVIREHAFHALMSIVKFDSSYVGNLLYFQKAAADPLPSIQKLAVRFLPKNDTISPQNQEVLFELIASENTEVSNAALIYFVSHNIKPTPGQSELIEELAKTGDPRIRHLLKRGQEGFQ